MQPTVGVAGGSRLVRGAWALCAIALLAPAAACGGGGSDDSSAATEPVAAAETTAPAAGETTAAPASTSTATVPAPTTPAVPDELIVDGRVTDAVLAAATTADGEPNVPVIDAVVAALRELPEAEQLAVVADLSRRAELEAAAVSGLQDELGGAAATEAAVTGAWQVVAEQVDAATPTIEADTASWASTPPTTAPGGLRRAGPPTAGTVAALGVFMGMLALGVVADTAVSAANGLQPDQYREGSRSKGTTVSGAIEQSTLEMEFQGQQDGVDVSYRSALVVHPCPDPTGKFDIQATLAVSTSAGGKGTNATIDLRIAGTVDDDARLANADATTRTEWADFGGGGGQYVDFTATRTSGATTYTTNRTGGTPTAELINMAVLLSGIFAAMVEDYTLKAAEKAWTSGRCVQLNVTPSDGPDDLQPSATVSVLAEPRSKVDGSPTGGNVTATLSAGGASVDPNGSPLPADATSTYVAPDQPDESGTVAYEARSRRGVGRAELTFRTGGTASYVIVGGLEDWQVNQVVCDVMQPFTLSSDIGTMQLSGGLSGTYTFSGMFNAQYTGTYVIDLPGGPGQPGTMIGSGGGSIAGQAGSGSENYVLTPTEC